MSKVLLAGHRGYKALHPENTINSFQAAVEAGCDVIELDLHTSSDGYVVITHDVNTGRVFGEQHEISKTKYKGVLDQLLTIAKPRSHMPLLQDVFDWCVQINEKVSVENREIKLMLDIKSDNEPKFLMKKLWDECQKKRPGLTNCDMKKYWKSKLILGLWNSKFYDPEIAMHFTVVNIAFDIKVAKTFYKEIKEKDLKAKIDAISMINLIMYRNKDKKELLDFANQENIKLWFWTVNENLELRFIINECLLHNNKSLLEGVITDDPIKLFEENTANLFHGWKFNLKIWIKTNIYSLLLFMFRGGYNLRPMIYILKTVGFM